MSVQLENAEAAETALLMSRLNELGERLASADLSQDEREGLQAEALALGTRAEELEQKAKRRAGAIEAEKPYRTTWRRIGAIFLDGAALAPLTWADQVVWGNATQPLVLLPWAVVYSLASLAYPIVFVAVWGQTPGKIACGVKVLDLLEGPVSRKQAVLREIAPVLFLPVMLLVQAQNILRGQLANHGFADIPGNRYLLYLFLGWTALEVLTMLTNRKRRAVHDFIAGTVVVRVPPVKPLLFALVVLLVIGWMVESKLR